MKPFLSENEEISSQAAMTNYVLNQREAILYNFGSEQVIVSSEIQFGTDKIYLQKNGSAKIRRLAGK